MSMQRTASNHTRAWVMYDWANSVYPLIISSAIFPIFYEKVTRDASDGVVQFLGHSFINTEFYGYVVAASYLVVALCSPILSGMADSTGKKKSYLEAFCYLGGISCMGLFFFDAHHIGASMLALFFASIGYWGSLVFYNAYLPEVAQPADQDKVSARGFAMGYLGSSLLLILVLVGAVFNHWFTIRQSFLLVGLWWIGFAQVTLRILPHSKPAYTDSSGILTRGYHEIKKVWNEVRNHLQLKRFLYAYFLYNMGVQTVMIMAVPFATKAISWSNDEERSQSLIISILLIQFLGIAGSFIISKASAIWGNLRTLLVLIFLWILICAGTYGLVHTPVHFYAVAASVGLVMGGIQSLSRSTFSKMLPDTHDHASYFSFFDVSEKVGLAIGTSMFGLIEGLTGGIRQSVLSVIIAFVLGFVLLLRVPKSKQVQ